jgi:outer membrane lipopolysaccharide assembly protein LptE/RlpB
MSRDDKFIEVKLTGDETDDFLAFTIDEDIISVNLNSENSQNSLKDVFAKLLEYMLTYKVKLQLVIEKGYSKGLYIDVSKEYIKQLNEELLQADRNLSNTFNLD